MTAALRALMSGVIDYAGLFPPAKLSLDEAVKEYLAIRESPEAWMLGRFVMPAFEVNQLSGWADELGKSGEVFPLALTGRRCSDVDDSCASLLEDIYPLTNLVHGAMSSQCHVSLELPLPAEMTGDWISRNTFNRLFEAVEEHLDELAVILQPFFLEVSVGAQSSPTLESLAKQIRDEYPVGLKCRTGGVTRDAFPSVEDVARFIHICRKYRCLWKATAGLHHPLRHTDAKLGVKMHGFLNVLFAAVLANAHQLPESVICEILADEDATGFHVSDHGIRWRDYSATVEQIDSTRSTTFQSFGSCSFNEPRDDLKKLGLL